MVSLSLLFVNTHCFRTMHTHWVHDLDPVAIQITEDWGIRWYGMAYFVGFLAAYSLFSLYYKKGRSNLDSDLRSRFFFFLIIGVLVGGRLGNVLFYGWDAFLEDPLYLFQLWRPGMASHGGFIGVILATVWFSWSAKQRFSLLGDILCTLPGIGFFLGRLANFVNGELWGKATTLPWAVIFPHSPYPLVPRHPSQLYEALLEGALVFAYTQYRFWRTDICKTYPGHLCGEFFILYALGRMICDVFRETDASLIWGMPRGTFLSLFLLAFGIGFIIWARFVRGRVTAAYHSCPSFCAR